MKKHSLMTSMILGSLILGSSATVLAAPRDACDNGDRQEKRMEKRLERMADKLELTDDQQAAIKALWEKQEKPEKSEKPRRPAMPGEGLRSLDPNAEDYAEQVQKHIEQAQERIAQRMQAQAEYKAALYDILTPEQEETLEKMRDRFEDRRGKGERDRRGHH